MNPLQAEWPMPEHSPLQLLRSRNHQRNHFLPDYLHLKQSAASPFLLGNLRSSLNVELRHCAGLGIVRLRAANEERIAAFCNLRIAHRANHAQIALIEMKNGERSTKYRFPDLVVV
jgi:hypothetical protein